jgi:hypothetical protein
MSLLLMCYFHQSLYQDEENHQALQYAQRFCLVERPTGLEDIHQRLFASDDLVDPSGPESN